MTTNIEAPADSKWEPLETKHFLLQVSFGEDEQGKSAVSGMRHFEFVNTPAHLATPYARTLHQLLKETTEPQQQNAFSSLCGKYYGPLTGTCRHKSHSSWCKACTDVAVKLKLFGTPGVVIPAPAIS